MDDRALWDQLLAALLAEHRLISPEQLEAAEALGQRRGESLRTTIIREGFIEEAALEALYSDEEDGAVLPLPGASGVSSRADAPTEDGGEDEGEGEVEAGSADPLGETTGALGPDPQRAAQRPGSARPGSASPGFDPLGSESLLESGPALPRPRLRAERLSESLASAGSLPTDSSWPDDLSQPESATDPSERDPERLAPVPPGKRLGAYVVVEELGRGGCGIVHRAYDLRAEREVALKQLLKANETSRRRFAREREAARRLRHPNVVAVLDEGEAGGLPYLVMELVDGPSLAVLARDEDANPAPPPPETAVRILLEAARGVQAAHAAGVLHRDLKPHNVLVGSDGHAKVADFGLAQMLDRGATFTREGATVGTLAFMAPEQIGAGGQTLDERCDVYALGATLFFALTGAPPFDSRSYAELLDRVRDERPRAPSELQPAIAPALDALVARCLAKDPRERPPSAAALAEDLERYLAGTLRIEPAPPAPVAPSPRLLLAVGLSGLAAALVGVSLARALVRGEGPVAPPAGPSVTPAPSLATAPAARALPARWSEDALARALEDLDAPGRARELSQRLGGLRARLRRGWEEACGAADLLAPLQRLRAGVATRADQEAVAAGASLAAAPAREERGEGPPFARGAPTLPLLGLLADDTSPRTPALGDATRVPGGPWTGLVRGPACAPRAELQWLGALTLRCSGLQARAAARVALWGGPPPARGPAAWEGAPSPELAHGLSELLALLLAPQDERLVARALCRAPGPAPQRALLAARALRDEAFARALAPWVAAAPPALEGAQAARWASWAGDHERALAPSAPALRGELLLAAGREREARAALSDLPDDEPDPRAWLARARARRGGGLGAGAREDLRQARDRAPASAAIAREEARLELAEERPGPARAALRRALWLDPASVEGWRLAASWAETTGRRRTQERCLDLLLELDPADEEGRYARGLLRLRRDDLRGAIADAAAGLLRDPRAVRLLILRGTAFEREDRLAEALRDFERAVVLDPDNALAWADRAHVRTRSGDPAAALDDVTEALRHAPRMAVAWLNRGEALRVLGRLDEADEAFREAGRLGSRGAAFGLAASARARGDETSELAHLADALRREPARVAAWDRRAELRAARGDLEGACHDLARAAALAPSAERYRQRAALLEAAGRPDLAAADRARSEALGE